MDESLGRQQTTKGIWLNRNAMGNMLVLDIEGTDSKERGEQRMVSQIDQVKIVSFCSLSDLRANDLFVCIGDGRRVND